MSELIVHETDPIVLVGGGKVKKSTLQAAIVHGKTIVAADGAADVVLRYGLVPDAVIGDFDSISTAARKAIPAGRQHRIAEQDSTDFEKCLGLIAAPLVIGVGFSGGRLDHQLAALHGLIRYPEQPCVLLGKRDLVFLAPPEVALDPPVKSRFSLFPMMEVGMRSEGLRWPLDGIGFAPGARIGTSNRVCGPVWLECDRPGMLVILPIAQLDLVVGVLADPGLRRWSVRSGQ